MGLSQDPRRAELLAALEGLRPTRRQARALRAGRIGQPGTQRRSASNSAMEYRNA